jgi:hypothetical protein
MPILLSEIDVRLIDRLIRGFESWRNKIIMDNEPTVPTLRCGERGDRRLGVVLHPKLNLPTIERNEGMKFRTAALEEIPNRNLLVQLEPALPSQTRNVSRSCHIIYVSRSEPHPELWIPKNVLDDQDPVL